MVKYKDNRTDHICNKYHSYKEFVNDMQPLIDYAEASGDREGVHLFKKLAGILPNEATRQINLIGLGSVDLGLAGVLTWLQKHNIKTLASCSGLKEDHKEDVARGYISFLDCEESRNFIEQLCDTKEKEAIFEPTISYTYFIKSLVIYFSEDGLKVLQNFIRS